MQHFFSRRLFLLLLMLCPAMADADTIFLKNGRTIENVSTWEAGSQIKCYRFGAVVGYLKENVERVEKLPVTESPLVSSPPNADQDASESALVAIPREGTGEFKVTKVVDGDTFNAVGHGIEIKARLIGIDAPETKNRRRDREGQPYSEEAGAYLSRMIMNKTVAIKGYGIGRYNRQLVEVFVGGRNINLELLKAGLAEVYQGKFPKAFAPDPYWKAEKEARLHRSGMWILGDRYVSPKKWRKMKSEG